MICLSSADEQTSGLFSAGNLYFPLSNSKHPPTRRIKRVRVHAGASQHSLPEICSAKEFPFLSLMTHTPSKG